MSQFERVQICRDSGLALLSVGGLCLVNLLFVLTPSNYYDRFALSTGLRYEALTAFLSTALGALLLLRAGQLKKSL